MVPTTTNTIRNNNVETTMKQKTCRHGIELNQFVSCGKCDEQWEKLTKNNTS